MPAVDLFQPRTEEAVRDALRRAKLQARKRMVSEYDLAIDYLEGRQTEDVRKELSIRYERTQSGRAGQQITPVTVPLVARYVAEAADAYSRPVTRHIVTADGETNEQTEKLTSELQAMLDSASFDERMRRVDEIMSLVGSAGLWFQGRAGKLRPQIVLPQDVYPVAPGDSDFHDPSDQNDYEAFITELSGMDDGQLVSKRKFAWVSSAQTAFYCAGGPYDAPNNVEFFDNPFRWPQMVDTGNMRGSLRMLPLLPFVVLQRDLPVGELLPDVDPDIVRANQELNLQLSVLLDTLAHQGWALPVFNLMDPESPPSSMSAGPRFGISLGVGESMSMLNSAANYTDLVNVLQLFIKTLAVSHSQSPNDFAVDGAVPASGFAKLVDSLPKLEARRKRVKRLKAIEEQLVWPRLASIGSALGLLSASPDTLAKLRMSVEYSDIEFPKSVDEEIKRDEHALTHGMTTPAKLLAKRSGISLQQAEEEIAENTGAPVVEEQEEEVPIKLDPAQISTMKDIVLAVVAKDLPRSSGVAMLRASLGLSEEAAENIMGDAGAGFEKAPPPPEPKAPEPPAPQPQPTADDLLGQLISRRK